MTSYEVDPLVSIHVDDVINTFYPSRIDNSKILIGGQNSFDVISIDSEWKYKNEQIRLQKERRRGRPFPVLYLKPHPNEMYTMATANASGTIILWDFDYDKCVKAFSPLGSHQSMCQGLSWCPTNSNLLLSCGQDGTITLWDRRTKTRAREWEVPSGAKGFSSISFDPFHENLFSCIHDDSTIYLFDVASNHSIHSFRSETNAAFNIIMYNPYKPNVMAAGCCDHSIKLLSATSNGYANIYSTLYHYADDTSLPPPTCIETEFEIKDISWNPQNPNVIAACGMSDTNSIGIWDIRRPTLPYKILHQTQRVKEICWMTHPGSSSSEEYLSVLQDSSSHTTIDIFITRSLSLFSSTVCRSALSISRWYDVACVLNGHMINQEHVPETISENEIFACTHQSPILVLKEAQFRSIEEGYVFDKSILSFLSNSYVFYRTKGFPTLESVCCHNAEICEDKELSSIASIWSLLANMADIAANQVCEDDSHVRSQSIVSPRVQRSRGDSLSSLYHTGSFSEHGIPRSNSCYSFDDSIYTPNLCDYTVKMSLKNDLQFLYSLVQEGDLLNAIAIVCVFWDYIRCDAQSVREVQKWVACYMDILSREEMYEELVEIRRIALNVGIPIIEDYNPVISFQTATKQDQEDFHLSPQFFATGSKPFERPSTPDVPFIVTGKTNETKSKSVRKGKRQRKEETSRRKGNELVMKMTKSKDTTVNSLCSVCKTKNQGMVAMCLRCGHGGHLKHIQEWFDDEHGNKEKHCAIPTCNCHCVFANWNQIL